MSPGDQLREMFGAFDAQDVSALAGFVTDDVHLRLGNAEPVEGRTAFVESVTQFIASVAGFRHEFLNIWSDRDALIAEFDVHYIRLDGGEVTLPCCNVFRVRDGLVAEYHSYMDATPVYS
jgi:ketosteroid isomerase-like protein